MPTHVSANVKELKELGRNLYAVMRSDFEVNPNASALPIDYFEHIVTWYCASLKDITSRFFMRTSLDVMWHHFFMENWGELNAHR